VASDTEEILGDPMHRQEPLRLSRGFEPSHALRGAELQTPQSDGLVTDDDPPFCQKIFDISEAQAEPVVEQHG
jgi:hypothetical protein